MIYLQYMAQVNEDNQFFNHKKIDSKWQKNWEKEGVYKASNTSKKPKKYVLSMFPYPSGAGLHVGHPRGYIGADVYARLKRMQGFNVLHPMGYDAFGLPAEQYAIQHGVHPKDSTAKNIKTYQKQLEIIGLSYDWSRKINTTDEDYYKWTQWIFLKLYNHYYDHKAKKAKPISELELKFKHLSQENKDKELMKYRLAYEGFSEVNWCEELGTVLANDEVIDGKSERGGYPVVKKTMRQWFLRITDYADRLISGLDTVDFDESLKTVQRNWIGKSFGHELSFQIKGDAGKCDAIKVFTTRIDTLSGVTFLAISKDHDLILKNQDKFSKIINQTKSWSNDDVKRSEVDIKIKQGILIDGVFAMHPDTQAKLPIYVTNYVLSDYGFGAIMGVPDIDTRDGDFASMYNISIKETKIEDVKNIEKRLGLKKIYKYKIRDAVFARQRYWGEPIPLRHVDGKIIPLTEKELPLKLPKVSSYEPIGSGESPLAGIKSWIKEGYETNTMPGWAASSWYFLRYMDAHNKTAPVSKKAVDYWQQVDMYVGGREHATGHLLYSRFWHKFLFDIGITVTEEPFKALRNQGMILGSDNQKMSKRWGNVVNPDDCIATYGADAFRMYEMFLGPFDSQLPWSTDGIIGTRRFIDRTWRFAQIVKSANVKNKNIKTDIYLISKIHKTTKKVTEDIDGFAFNTSISSLMILLNDFEEVIQKGGEIAQKDFLDFIKLLSPFAPHISDEIWLNFGNKKSINVINWPVYDVKKILEDKVKIGIQVNGKLRGAIEVAPEAIERDVIEEAKKIVKNYLEGQNINKTIYIKGKIISFVI
jgi:leucyl-tRNA synthetase